MRTCFSVYGVWIFCGFHFSEQFRPVCWTGYLCALVCVAWPSLCFLEIKDYPALCTWLLHPLLLEAFTIVYCSKVKKKRKHQVLWSWNIQHAVITLIKTWSCWAPQSAALIKADNVVLHWWIPITNHRDSSRSITLLSGLGYITWSPVRLCVWMMWMWQADR